MKITTLTFDANLPTTQQVNVPTNTDYKVGMKVKRNGEIQQLGPDEITITDPDGNTIPTDADKTNGYVTFTQAAGDDANFRQLKVAIEHGYDYADTTVLSGQFPAVAPDPNPSITEIKAGDVGLTGKTIKASDYASLEYWTWRNASTPSADLSAWTHRWGWDPTSTYSQLSIVMETPPTSDGETFWMVWKINADTTLDANTAVPELVGTTLKAGQAYFIRAESVAYYGYKLHEITQTRTLKADDGIWYSGGLRFTANYYWAKRLYMSFGTPFTANFKLNVNEFKSQCGDLNAQTDPDFNTAKVEGTYADGTEFSFDFCTK